MNLKNMNKDDRPMERCMICGAQSLTDAELLALIFRTGTHGKDALMLAREVLSIGGSECRMNSILHHSSEDFLSCRGIGMAKAVQLLCISEISKRMWRQENNACSQSFLNPQSCASYYMQEMRSLEQEELRIAFLDSRHKLTGDSILSRGTVNASLVSVREIMIEALRHRAVNLILVHNHPSGNPNPSKDDTDMTLRVSDAGKLIGITLSDHIIIGDNTYFSYKERGMI